MSRAAAFALALLLASPTWADAQDSAPDAPDPRGAPPSSSTSTAAPAPPPPPPPPASAPRTAPPAQTAPPPPPAADQEHGPEDDDDDDDDGGDSEIFWIDLDFGFSWVDLVRFNADNFIPETEKTSATGYTTGLGLGFRFAIVTVGARATLSSYTDFEVGTVGIDLGLRIPIPVIEPYIRGGLSYAWMGDADYEVFDESVTEVTGLAASIGGGFDIYLHPRLSLGAGFDAVFLNLSRQKIDGGVVGMVGDVDVSETGDSVGFLLRATAHAGLHF